MALVKSIHEGVFFDRKYWAPHSRKGSALKAVYFSSVMIGNELEVCEQSHIASGSVTEGMPKVSHVPVEKVLR
jgi:hypothetical protein